jgi:hypothetical protein
MYLSILVILICMLIAIISDSLAWGKLCSQSRVNAFGPPVLDRGSLSAEQINNIRKKNGQISEITRTVAITIICFFAIVLFGNVDVFSAIQHNVLVKILFLIGILYGVIYYMFVGPSKLAKISDQNIQLISQRGFREYFVPYLVRLPGFFAAILGIFGILVINIIIGIQNDFKVLLNTSNEIFSLLQHPQMNLADHQIISLRLVGFGDWISISSQKYIVISLLLLFLLVFVQSSFLRRTIFEASVNKYKLMFWIIAIASIGFSVIYLPLLYFNLQHDVHNSLQDLIRSFQAAPPAPADGFSNLLSLEEFLLEHDTSWLILRIFSGYGNIAVAITIFGGFLIKKVFLSEVSAITLLSLLLPARLSDRLSKYFRQIGVEENIDHEL